MYVLGVLEIVMRVGVILLFPVLAVWAWRAGGGARLWRIVGLAIGLILLLGAFVASAIGGNALTPTYGYAHIAPRVLLLHTLTMALPVAVAALAVHLLAGRWASRFALYAVGVVAAGLAWVTGVLVAFRIFMASGGVG
jgi:hypothetical protein